MSKAYRADGKTVIITGLLQSFFYYRSEYNIVLQFKVQLLPLEKN